MVCNGTLLYGFDVDRRFFIDGVEWLQTWIPVLDTLTVHPAMLFLLWQNNTMGLDLRIGYLIKSITLIMFDWVFNFSLRWYSGLPYSAEFCGGPICSRIGVQAIHFVMAVIINVNASAFLFLLVRMHNQSLYGSESMLKLSDKTQTVMFSTLGIINVINVIGFTYYGREADDALEIESVCELKWMAERGGRMIAYGSFGEPQHFRYSLYFMGATLVIASPMAIILTLNSVKKLWLNRVVAVSDKTLKLTEKLVKVFTIQLIGATIFMIIPLTAIFSSLMIDLHDSLSDRAMTVTRVVVNVAFVLDPLHFPLIFILKNRGDRTIVTYLSRRLRNIRGKSSGCRTQTMRPDSSQFSNVITVRKKT